MEKPEDTIDIFLQPGDFFFGDSATRIRTILGSCVSLTFWHPKLFIGGMCHIMLPSRAGRTLALANVNGKYADEAFDMFMAEIDRTGTKKKDYQVKVFGGGDMFNHQRMVCQSPTVGQKNIQMVLNLINQHGFNVHAEHLGGRGHRYIIFDVWSGDVWMKYQPQSVTARAA